MRSRVAYILVRVALLLMAALFLLPVYMMLSMALKSPPEAARLPPTFVPQEPTLDAFRTTLSDTVFLRYMFNGLVVSVGVAAGLTIVSLLAAYAFARLNFRGRELLFGLVLATMMVPFEVLVIPEYVVVHALGWFDQYPGLIVPLLAHPFSVFVLRQMMLQVPRELGEAAVVDGAGQVRIFFRIICPLVVPGIAVVAFLAFVRTWGDLLWPLIITSSTEMRTPQVGLLALSQQVGSLPLAMAGASVVVLPTVIAFLLMQRRIIATLAHVGIR